MLTLGVATDGIYRAIRLPAKRRKFPKDSFPNYVYALVTLSYSEKDYQLQPANNFHVKTNTSI